MLFFRSRNKKFLFIVFGILLLIGVGAIFLFRSSEDSWIKDQNGDWVMHGNPKIKDFDSCVKKYPVIESYPEKCSIPNGPTFTREISTENGDENAQTTENVFSYPTAEFKERITKKTFGQFITRENSPVQPERFSGYHTAVDVEYSDVEGDVPVYALADSIIVLSRIATGYGGVFVLDFEYEGERRTAIYGHIKPSTLPVVNTRFNKGDKIALLGKEYTSETDGERKHLHFGIRSDNQVSILGYVQSESELTGWQNPLDLFD
jgi:murein DD-endopeptidase MepM/ murein hydrolase activator NlpD